MRQGEPARFGEPRLLELRRLGIRSLSWWRDRYLLVGGSVASEAPSRLFTWRGGEDVPVESLELSGLNPEAFVSPEDSEDILVLSDDGTVVLEGVECKRLKGPARKRFRGVWLRLPDPCLTGRHDDAPALGEHHLAARGRGVRKNRVGRGKLPRFASGFG